MGKKQVALSFAAGGLKASAAGLASAYVHYVVLKDYVDVVAVAGCSGGSIAAGAVSLFSESFKTNKYFVQIISKEIEAFKESEIVDQDIVQYILDHAPILAHFRKSTPLTGIIKGKGIKKCLAKLYNNKLFSEKLIPTVITATSLSGTPPYDRVFFNRSVCVSPEQKINIVEANLNLPIPMAKLVRASTAIPGIFRPEVVEVVHLNGIRYTEPLCDGGTLELVPDGSLSKCLDAANIVCDYIFSVSVLGSAYGKVSLSTPLDFFDVLNAAYAMHYQSTFDRRKNLKHQIIENKIGGLTVKMTDPKGFTIDVLNAIEQLIHNVSNMYEIDVFSEIEIAKNIFYEG